MKYGFTVYLYGKDWFMESNKKCVTSAVTLDLINKIQNKRNSFFNVDKSDIDYLKTRIEHAVYTDNGHCRVIKTKNSSAVAPSNDDSMILL